MMLFGGLMMAGGLFLLLVLLSLPVALVAFLVLALSRRK